jgi:DNA-binding response OmpR family regulator
VLICDDEPDVLALLELHVTRAGLRPRRSLTASECLSMLENARPMARALVVDLLLPDLNGIEICRRVRQGSIWPRVPVIIYTALDDALARERAREAGAHAYVVKSDGVYPLVAAVRCAVDAAA